jgi:hypothetical protein
MIIFINIDKIIFINTTVIDRRICYTFLLIVQVEIFSPIVAPRVADPHSFHPDPDPDPDSAF